MRSMLLVGLGLVGCAQTSVLPEVAVVAKVGLPTSIEAQAELQDRWTRERFEVVLPKLMQEERVNLWALFARENNADPVLATMLPADWHDARRTTMLLLFAGREGLERVAISRYPVGELFESAWDSAAQPDQWRAFGEVIQAKGPRSIALNVSHDSALSDGLSSSLHMTVLKALPARYEHAVTLRHGLPVRWLETRTPGEQAAYPGLAAEAHALIKAGLEAVEPGVTTTDELAWWYADSIRERGFAAWFHPQISVQRAGGSEAGDAIAPGDLLHVDVGLVWAGLHTDMQNQAYVLRAGETDAPAGLIAGFAAGVRAQDLLMERFRVGATGNELLESTRDALEEAGIDARIYTHPIGLHGHGAGPLIGLWDKQDGVMGRGNFPVHADTAWAIELGVTQSVPEWGGQAVDFLLEEDALFDGKTIEFLDGRQTTLTLLGG